METVCISEMVASVQLPLNSVLFLPCRSI